MSAAARFYSRWARVYAALSQVTPGLGTARRRAVAQLAPPSGGTVVEMGCGPGPNTPTLSKAVGTDGTVLGIDVASGAVERAAARSKRAGPASVHVCVGDVTQPPIADTDAIFAAFVVGMLPDPAATIEKWCDIVGPGGRIGLLHFARSERTYQVLPNALLGLLVRLSTPDIDRFDDRPTVVLDRRVRAAHDVLGDRCVDLDSETGWGGVLYRVSGTVAGD